MVCYFIFVPTRLIEMLSASYKNLDKYKYKTGQDKSRDASIATLRRLGNGETGRMLRKERGRDQIGLESIHKLAQDFFQSHRDVISSHGLFKIRTVVWLLY